MPRSTPPSPHVVLSLPPRQHGESAHLWLCAAVRDAILRGVLRPGARLPATRDLARQLDIARGTVVRAFEQLTAEGYVSGTRGSGTFVSRTLPDELLAVAPTLVPAAAHRRHRSRSNSALLPRTRTLSRYAERLREFPSISQRPMRAFRANQPSIDLFPTLLWARTSARRQRTASARHFTGCAALGYAPLQESIAEYLRSSRGVRCDASHVCVVSGVQEALDIASRLTLDPGDVACMEDPGYLGARLAFESIGAHVESVAVDDEGMHVPTGRASRARLAYVTSSHQYPLGMAMSLARRLTILEWARANDAMIFEDDYDAEYRYAGHPLPALQGLDAHGTVLFAGSFSKVLFPALRLGYLVVPPDLVPKVAAMKSVTHRHAPVLEQATLADFMIEGHFGRHVRRMREVYAARLAVLREVSRDAWGDRLVVPSIDAGLQTVGWLARGLSVKSLIAGATERDVELVSLSHLASRPLARDGVQLGFAAVDERELRRGVEIVARVLDSIGTKQRTARETTAARSGR